MRYILLHESAAARFDGTLQAHGFTPVALPPDKALDPIVAAHADTLLCALGDTVLVGEHYSDALPPILRPYLRTVSDAPHGCYPSDAAFNALAIGRRLFAREASLSPSVCDAAREHGLELVSVRQGYAKCSTLALALKNAAITADLGMASAMEAHGIEVLRVACGNIALAGCEYGFIGGASFVEERAQNPTVYFFGDIQTHPDAEAIAAFIEAHGYALVSLGGALTDYGGAVILEI